MFRFFETRVDPLPRSSRENRRRAWPGNYRMIARWQMHRQLLKQSLPFVANEFTGPVATWVMQTSWRWARR